MLVRFTVENFACFNEEVEFSMVASSDAKLPRHLIDKV